MSGASGGSRAGSNALFLLLQGLAASVFGLLQMKLFTVGLGEEVFGLFLALRGLAVLLSSVGVMALPQLAQRFGPQLEVRGDRGALLRGAVTLVVALLGFYAVVGLAAWRFWPQLAGRVAPQTALEPLLLPTVFLGLALGLAELAAGLYQGLRRMAPMALAELLGLAGLTLHLFLRRATLDAPGALRLFALWFLLRALLLLALLPWWLPRGGGAPSALGALRIGRRQLLDYWLTSLPLRWLALAYFELDRYVIGMVAAVELVALFHVPARLVGISKRFLAAPVLSFQTEVSRLFEERREGELAARLQLILRGQLAVACWFAAGLYLAGRPLLLLLSTGAYLEALPLLALLAITLPLGSLVAVLEAALRGLDGLRAVLVGNLLWALLYYAALPLFIGRWGLWGLGFAQVSAAAVQAVWVMGVAARRGWLTGALGGVCRSALVGLAPAALGIAAALAWPGGSAVAPSAAGVGTGLALLASSALLALRGRGLFAADEKRWLLDRLPSTALRHGLGRVMGVAA
ncbi:MAG: hypothetical protein H6693_01635 [Candidatus Latescibacteria bacterium]|nr:hypothetical protein [Candidatus Latescibacterota bacterium]